MNTRRIRASLIALASSASLLHASDVHAGGLDLAPGGARSLGRGGANVAMPVDPMALLQNPAGLALLKDDQSMFNMDIPFSDVCVDLYGYYGWGVYDSGDSQFGDTAGAAYRNRPLDKVCNSAPVTPIPSLAFTFKLNEDLGIGFGFVAPTLLGAMQWGGDDGTIQTEDGPRPTPTRYQLVKQKIVFGLNPTLGVGYRLLQQLALGASVQVTMVKADNYLVQSQSAGTSPHADMLVKLQAEDYFIPTVVLSAHVKPTAPVDLTAAFRYVDDLSGPAEITYRTATYQEGAVGTGSVPFTNAAVQIDKVKVGFPWLLTLGARYAQALPGVDLNAPGGDPLDRERWDVEADFNYSFNARSRKNEVNVENDIVLDFRTADGVPQSPLVVSKDEIEQFNFDRHLEDAITLRLGGSYNLWPKVFAVSAGGFYESRGVDPAYANIDTQAFRRVGLGAGVLWRLGGFDFALSYGHLMQETLEVAPPEHQARQEGTEDPTTGFDQRVNGKVLADPDAPSAKDADAVARYRQSALFDAADKRARVVNAGKYTGSFELLSVGVTYHY